MMRRAVLLLVLACFISSAAAAEKLTGKLSFLESLCASVGMQLEADTLPANVSSVRLGAPSYHGGLRAGDRVLDFKVEGATLSLRVERNQQSFEARLPLNLKALRAIQDEQSRTPAGPRKGAVKAANLKSGLAVKSTLPAAVNGEPQVPKPAPEAPATALQASANQAQLKAALEDHQLLRQRRIILVIDKSGSMATKDPACGDISRFEWCRRAISGLATSPALSDKLFTLIFFNTDLDVVRNGDTKVVERMFSLVSPDGGTDLSLAITQALRESAGAADQPPAVIAVLHDGVVNRGNEIGALLIEASNRQSDARKLAITFLQIGDDRKGGELLNHLDTGLQANGAKFDIVDTVSFSTLKEIGLKNALINAIKESH
jgi:Mg-chelatase subunit ChlD